MSNKVELLPCPFCGNPARLESNRDWHRIVVDHDERCAFLEPESVMVPATDDQLSMAITCWNRRTDPAQQPAQAVPEDLRARCAEILAWQKTGVLKGDALRGYARAQWYADEHNSLQMAEADTARQAYAFLVAAPPSSAQEPVPVYLVLAEEDYEAPIVLRAFSDKGATEGFAQALRDYQQDRPEWPVGDADLEEIQESDEKTRAWMAAHPGSEDAAWRRFFSVLPVPFSAAPPAAEHPGTVRVPVEAMQRIHNTLDACQEVIWLAGCRPRGYGFDPVYVSDAQDRLKEIEALLGKEGEV